MLSPLRLQVGRTHAAGVERKSLHPAWWEGKSQVNVRAQYFRASSQAPCIDPLGRKLRSDIDSN